MPRAKALASTDGGATEAGPYRVVLADPPWRYDNTSARRYAARHYDGDLTVAQIAALPIGDLAAKDAALFLWVTMAHLPDAFAVMEAWGFTYRTTAFTWVKLNRDGTPFMGLGNYTRANAELCLLGLRGKPKRQARDVQQIVLACRREHSRKPDQVYERIMRLFDGPYIELFSRQAWPGWATYGNQTTKFPAQPFLFKEAM